MKTTKVFLFILIPWILSACGAAKAGSATPPVSAPVVADKTIIAEGRLEPVHYAEVALNTGGVINEVLVKEGDQVKKGAVLIRLGGETDKTYAGAQLELVTAHQAYDNLLNSSGTEAAQAVIDLKDAQEAYEEAVDYLTYLQDSKKVPQTETRQATRRVCHMVPVTETRTVCEDRGCWQVERQPYTVGCGECARTCYRTCTTWVPNVVTREVQCTVMRPQVEEVPGHVLDAVGARQDAPDHLGLLCGDWHGGLFYYRKKMGVSIPV